MRDKGFTRGAKRSSRIPLHGAWHWMQISDVQSPHPQLSGKTEKDPSTSAVNSLLAMNQRPRQENYWVPVEL